jgi:hypothetical protein
VVRAKNAEVIHSRSATGKPACPAASAGATERTTVALGKVTCWRCLEKLLGEPPIDVR